MKSKKVLDNIEREIVPSQLLVVHYEDQPYIVREKAGPEEFSTIEAVYEKYPKDIYDVVILEVRYEDQGRIN